MDVADFDFQLPGELIAQVPLAKRDDSRLLLLDRATGLTSDRHFPALVDALDPSDLLVVNNTRVVPARLLGRRVPSGGRVECLVMQPTGPGCWDALVHPGQKLKRGSRVIFETASRALHAEVVEHLPFGRRTMRLWTEDGSTVDETIDAIGHVPLPPYIARADAEVDRDRYQTVYGDRRGSVAAPTAGLHFTPEVLSALDRKGIETTEITLHVGYGTFKPVRVARVEDHTVDPEWVIIEDRAAATVNRALAEGRRVVAVGTTTTRALEAASRATGRVEATAGATDLFIAPGFEFRVVRGLLTNFHLPRSSLLMLVSAFAGRECLVAAYRGAIERRYRFYSVRRRHADPVSERESVAASISS